MHNKGYQTEVSEYIKVSFLINLEKFINMMYNIININVNL